MAKDTRKIVQGVQFSEGGTMRTYVPGQEDELEAAMTPEQHERLKEAGAIEGDWDPQGVELVLYPRDADDRNRMVAKLNARHRQLVRELGEAHKAEDHEAGARIERALAQLKAQAGELSQAKMPQQFAGWPGQQPSPPGGAGEGPEAHHLRAAPPLTPGKEEKKPPPLPENVPAHPAQPKQTPPPPKRPGVKGIDSTS